MKKLLVVFILLTVSICNLYAQNKMIKGRVISDFFEIMPTISIMINDSVQVGRTDLGGFFQIEIPDSVNKVSFLAVGLDPTNIELEDKCDVVEVIMMSSSTYDFYSPRRVNRLRLKRFKRLPELHKEAFDKGLFKTDTACYKQEFIPYFKKKQK